MRRRKEQRMAWRLVVSCVDCGTTRVTPNAVTLRHCVDTGDWSYRFCCPACHRTTVASTNRRAALDATARGGALETWTLPLPEHAISGEPFTEADLVELRAQLNASDSTTWLQTFDEAE